MDVITPTLSKQENNSIAFADNDKILSEQRAAELDEQYQIDQLHEGFYFCNNDLLYQPEIKSEQESPSPIFICSRLYITACTRDDGNRNHGRLLEFKDIDGCHHEWAMPMQLLAGDGTQYREELLSMGLRITPGPKARQLLTYYIQSSKPPARARCVTHTGWHSSCFILPDHTIGNCGKERVILQATSPHFPDYATSGTLNEWKGNVSALCIGNSRLIFSVSVAFASPLLHLLEIENGGFHFRGSSSTGKTTALAAAASVWGSKNYIQRWRTTINGIEALAAGHNDTLLCLDELSQVDPNVAGEIAYMIANGVGKTRADRHGYSKKKSTWRLLFLSTGEVSLADHMIEAGKKSKAGQEVRIVDIPADSHRYGLFENLHNHQNGDVFSQSLNRACGTYYGVPGREFLINLIKEKDDAISLIKQFSDEFLSNYVPIGADGQVYRAARRFALVAAAGELATYFGITGWKKTDALFAAKSCFIDWLQGRGGAGSQEEQSILSQVRRFFEQHGESRFTPWDTQSDHRTINRAGFRMRSDAGEIEYIVLPEMFKQEIAQGRDYVRVAKICIKHGLLIEGSKGEITRSERLPHMNKSTRCFRFTSKVLGNDEPGKDGN